MKLRKQVTVCGVAIFCVAVFSLYLMLDRVQHDPARRQNGGNFPRNQISVLQNRIEQLEQLLEENHQIISHIKDSVMELTDTGAVSPSGHLPFRSANGSWVLPLDGRPTFLAVKPQDCQFAVGTRTQTDVQVYVPHYTISHQSILGMLDGRKFATSDLSCIINLFL
ncbi:Alpha-mannosidase 2x [Characodon lateralis]|uniref:Alpha-mannosidase 2x n=1 Tax=Characodon lateralis TaxID=208331 RepID=A0ABU7DP25_9TELE|nr:Alpha-mannosidase 2x [Characodon lateralis]